MVDDARAALFLPGQVVAVSLHTGLGAAALSHLLERRGWASCSLSFQGGCHVDRGPHPACVFTRLSRVEVWQTVPPWGSQEGRCSLGLGYTLVTLSDQLVLCTSLGSDCHTISHLAVPECSAPVLQVGTLGLKYRRVLFGVPRAWGSKSFSGLLV